MDIFDSNCTPWISELINRNSSKGEINTKFRERNVGGIILVSVFIFLGFLGNFLVIIIFSWKFNKSTYRVYVICLALLDSISCCFTMPFVLTYLLFMQNYPSDVLCKIGHFIGFYIGIASPFMLIVIAVDRYKKVCKPLSIQWSAKTAKRVCIAVNIMALLLSWHVPLVYGISEIKSTDGNIILHQCFKEDNALAKLVTWWQYIALTVLMGFVSLSLIVTYLIILIRVRKTSKYFANNNAQKLTVEENKSYTTKNIQTAKVTVTFFLVTTVYVCSSLIHHTLALVLHVVPDLECKMTYAEGTVFWTFIWTIFLNNVANPVIYGISDKRFRRSLKSILIKE